MIKLGYSYNGRLPVVVGFICITTTVRGKNKNVTAQTIT